MFPNIEILLKVDLIPNKPVKKRPASFSFINLDFFCSEPHSLIKA